MGTDSQFDRFKIVRLTAPVFPTSEFEMQAFAAHGLPVTVVDAEEPTALIPHVADADVVTLIGTHLPTAVVDALDDALG